jgi:hypothetical protein
VSQNHSLFPILTKRTLLRVNDDEAASGLDAADMVGGRVERALVGW